MSGFAEFVSGRTDVAYEAIRRALRQQRLHRDVSATALAVQAAAPPPPTVATNATASIENVTFEFKPVESELVHGYNVYRADSLAPDSAQRIDFLPQPPDTDEPIGYDDAPGAKVSRYYWLTAVNQEGVESDKVAMSAGSTTTSGAVTALNGLTAASQTFAVGTAGTDFAIVSATSTHTFNLPSASATARGVVSITTQTFAGNKTFTGKVITAVSTTTQAGLNVPQGAAPTVPVAGDIWTVGETLLFRGATATQTTERLANKGVASGYVGLDASSNAAVAGDVSSRRLKSTGTATAAGDYALSAGWGATAAVAVTAGSTDMRGEITVTANGAGIAGNPLVTLTFKDGTFTTVPFSVAKMAGGTGTLANVTEASTATTWVISYRAVPVAGSTYIFRYVLLG